jgi:peptide/nickel transport system permease protein
MFKFIGQRVFRSILVMIGVSLVTFILLNIIPGDPVAVMLQKRTDEATMNRVRHELGLDRPLHIQYLDFITNAVKGNLGNSYFEKRPVSEMLLKSLETTLRLGLNVFIFAVISGITIGTLAAVFRGKMFDRVLMFISMLGISAPAFWVAVLLQIFFGLRLRMFPISGMNAPNSFVLPTIALGMRYVASIARLTRTNVLEALSQDYVVTARSKGVREIFVICIHVLKNASIPVVTLLGLELKDILGGSMVVEAVFSLPGMGSLAINAIVARDIPVVQGTVLFSAVMFVIVNLIVDLLYGLLDPRIRLEGV